MISPAGDAVRSLCRHARKTVFGATTGHFLPYGRLNRNGGRSGMSSHRHILDEDGRCCRRQQVGVLAEKPESMPLGISAGFGMSVRSEEEDEKSLARRRKTHTGAGRRTAQAESWMTLHASREREIVNLLEAGTTCRAVGKTPTAFPKGQSLHADRAQTPRQSHSGATGSRLAPSAPHRRKAAPHRRRAMYVAVLLRAARVGPGPGATSDCGHGAAVDDKVGTDN